MTIYAIVITVIAAIFALCSLKWKIATRALTLFCKEKFREPTKNEIADYSKRAAGKTFKG